MAFFNIFTLGRHNSELLFGSGLGLATVIIYDIGGSTSGDCASSSSTLLPLVSVELHFMIGVRVRVTYSIH